MKELLLILITLFVQSCSYTNKQTNIEKLKTLYNEVNKQDINNFKDLLISARCIRNEKYIVYKFTIRKGIQNLTIPNFEFCEMEECLDTSKYDVVKYANLNGIPKNKAYEYVKYYSNQTIENFQKLNIFKIHGIRQSSIIVFYIDNRNYLAYIPDKENIKLNFWKDVVKSDNKFSDTWYYITED